MGPCLSAAFSLRLARTPAPVWSGSPGRADLSFCTLANAFSLTPCFSWGLGGALARQPFQRLSADHKPLKAVARSRLPSPTLLKQGVNERAPNPAVHQRCSLVQKLRRAPPNNDRPWD